MSKHAFNIQKVKFIYACRDLERRLAKFGSTTQPISESFFEWYQDIVAMHEIIEFYRRIIDANPVFCHDELLNNHMSRMATYYGRALYIDNEYLYEIPSIVPHDLHVYFEMLRKAENNLRLLTGIKIRQFTPLITSRNMSWQLLEKFRKHIKVGYLNALTLSREQFEALGYTELAGLCNVSFNVINVPLFTVTNNQSQKNLYIKECVV